MVYLVTRQTFLFTSDYQVINEDKALDILSKCDILQYDSETDGRDAHLNKLLCIQFGSKVYDFQMVIDCYTINILKFKRILETKYIVGQNLKFDLQFLYNYKIIPRRVYDTMIVEQLLYLGYSNNPKDRSFVSVSLASIAARRLNKHIDKTIRGEIIWRGLDNDVILYAANDVKDLEDIMWQQVTELTERKCLKAAELECNFVPVCAYLEWCGIKLDQDKWKAKMQKDIKHLNESIEALNNFVLETSALKEFTFVDTQGDLFLGYNLKPKVTINWSSSPDVCKVAKVLGFNVAIQNKNGEEAESAMKKSLVKQKGINDTFLKLYFGKGEEGDSNYFPGYSGSFKVVSSFGQGHLNAINPITGRIHTIYKQLGCDTGRMSSGSKQINTDLAKYKGFPTKPSSKQNDLKVSYPNMQQLPSDEDTRACFISEKGNKWVSCDYSAIESRLGADIYNEPSMKEEFLHGSGDIHSLVAKMIFPELKDVPVKEIKKNFKHLRSKAKPVEFSQQFGGSPFAIQNAMGCTMKEAEDYANGYNKGFSGIAKFKTIGEANVKKLGYILLNPITGHKTYWWDWKEWQDTQRSFTKEFWDDYRLNHKGTGDDIAIMVKNHFKSASKWSRKALNSVTQGTGAIILKESQILVFDWIVKNNYFSTILLNNLTHDEANWEYPESISEFPSILKSKMESVATKYCKSLPIPADAEISDHWVH